MKKIAAAFVFLFLAGSTSLLAQEKENEDNDHYQVGIEIQVYPTGIIPGVRIEHFLNEKNSVHFRVAAQLIDHRDFGVHDDEKGYGGGFSLGYRHFFKQGHEGLSLALRADYWRNYIDWEDSEPNFQVTGSTTVQVLQPTAMLEYAFQKKNLTITPSVSFGYEWNAVTDGEPTGEGAILLVGVTFGF